MWQRVDQPEVLATVEELEPVARNALLSDPGPYWCCSLCDYESSIEWVDDHLEEVYVSTPLLLRQLRRAFL